MWPSLDETTRAILEKKYILGQSDSEIAHSLGIKASSVRMNLTRARKSAYEQLKVYME
jgi:RNA polymerase sigma-70 factor (ECF subfamily)